VHHLSSQHSSTLGSLWSTKFQGSHSASFDDLVEGMYESCPNLRDKEFGTLYMLADHHWCRMMELYGPQLESLSIWGKVIEFNSNAFMTLMGSLSRILQHRCLTRPNINGMEHLHGCAWKALYRLPLLKQFKARDVSEKVDGSARD